MTEIGTAPGSFDETVALLIEQLGFRLDLIAPADQPAVAVLSRDGQQLTVRRSPPVDVLSRRMQLPPGTQELVISQLRGEVAWGVGRAGMRYRDLIPSRLGGRYIASHIEVCDGGPVADMVHHHAVRFQLIFCQRGWVDVVYEDQGAPFRMHGGDCVTQPPHIRHKVLASSPGARVVEIGCPAEHDTLFDHDLELPNGTIDHERRWNGQRFVRHVSANAPWLRSDHKGFDEQVTEVASATAGLADVRVLRPRSDDRPCRIIDAGHGGEFRFVFVLHGVATMGIDAQDLALAEGDSITVPSAMSWTLETSDSTLRLLDVSL